MGSTTPDSELPTEAEAISCGAVNRWIPFRDSRSMEHNNNDDKDVVGCPAADNNDEADGRRGHNNFSFGIRGGGNGSVPADRTEGDRRGSSDKGVPIGTGRYNVRAAAGTRGERG